MSYEVIRHSAGGKAIAYIFDKMVKDNSAGHWQIGARFKGRGDREWIVIYVPSDSDHSYNGFIRLFNQEKGDIVIRPEEMAKAARLLTNFYNSPSLAGNEKRTTQSGSQASPKSVRHSAVDDDDVIDCVEDEYLEHAYDGTGTYPFKPSVSINGNTITVVLSDPSTKETHQFTVLASGSYKDIEDRIDVVLKDAWANGLGWGYMSKRVWDDMMRQIKSLYKPNGKTSMANRPNSKSVRHSALGNESAFKPNSVNAHVYIPDRKLTDRPGYIGLACYSSKDNEVDIYVPINQIKDKRNLAFKFTQALKAKDKLGSFRNGSMNGIEKFFEDELYALNHSAVANSYVGNPNVNGPNSKVLRMVFTERQSGLYDNSNGVYVILHYVLNGGYGTNPNGTNEFGKPVFYDPRYYNDVKHYERKVRESLSNLQLYDGAKCSISPAEVTKAARFATQEFTKYRNDKAHSQHQGYYSPNLNHSALAHHGILGQKWGVRRYQNADGSLTDLGKKHYGLGDPKYQRKKGLAETETVMKRLNAVRNGKDVYIDKEKFRNSTGDEDEFKTGEAHAKATENYANYLSNSYRMFDSMIPRRMSGKAREEYIKYLLNQTVADLNANHLGTVEKGVKIVYQLDTSRGLDDIDFKLEFEYPDQRKIK